MLNGTWECGSDELCSQRQESELTLPSAVEKKYLRVAAGLVLRKAVCYHSDSDHHL